MTTFPLACPLATLLNPFSKSSNLNTLSTTGLTFPSSHSPLIFFNFSPLAVIMNNKFLTPSFSSPFGFKFSGGWQMLIKVPLSLIAHQASSLEDAWWAIKDNGTLISICQPPENLKPKGLEKEGVRNLLFIMTANGEKLKKISGLWEEGKVRPVVDSVFKFEDFENGFKRVASGHAKGKVVISLG